MRTLNFITAIIASCISTTTLADCIEQDNTRFSVNAEQQTVTDNRSGLMWQYCANGLSGNECELGADTELSLSATQIAAEQANTGGFDDWRLPTVKELNSIQEIRCYAPSIASNAFPNTPAKYFWTSNAFVADLQKSWVVSFYFGEDGVALKKQLLPSRFVRKL